MGPFAWLAGRWTPEFEYRDRLADEVEDIAYESTRIGARRGFLMGVLVGAILVVLAIASFRTSELEKKPPPIAARQESRQQAPRPQPPSEELTLLRQENEQLKRELATARAAGVAAQREKQVVEPAPSQAKKASRAVRASKSASTDAGVKPEAKASPPRDVVAQPIPSNCRQEGVCDPTGP
jgi:hypothetical protein